jgi:predicted Zn-dependent protease
MKSLRFALLAGALTCIGTYAGPTFAQFNLNKIFDNVKKVAETASKLQEANREISQEEEIAMGQGIAASVLGASSLHPNQELQQYVNRVGVWIASQSERPDLPWMFGVLETDTIAAFAIPGGIVFVSHGLLKRLNNESELAGVLAHEIAHVVQKHNLKAIQSNASGEAWSSLGKEVAGQAIARRGNDRYGLKSAAADAGVGLVKDGVFLRPLDRGLEFEADRVGAVLAARAGYDPNGLVSAQQMLQAATAEEANASHFLSSHPPPAERIAEMEKLAPKLLDRFSNQAQLEARYRQVVNK